MCGLRMFAAKNSRKRRATLSPAAAISAGTTCDPCKLVVLLAWWMNDSGELVGHSSLLACALLSRKAAALLSSRSTSSGVRASASMSSNFSRAFRPARPASHAVTAALTMPIAGDPSCLIQIVAPYTAKSRFARTVAAVNDWCRKNRHWSLRDQHHHLCSMMRGHFAYYGVGGNSRRLRWFANQVVRIWRKWLSRRDRQGVVRWTRFNELLARHPLPSVKILHGYAAASESLS